MLISPIIRTKTRYFRHAYPSTRDNIYLIPYSEVKLKSSVDSSVCLFQTVVNWKCIRQVFAYTDIARGVV
jgi:hypothetical protein